MSHQLDRHTGRTPRATCPTCESRLVELSEMRELAFQRGLKLDKLEAERDARRGEVAEAEQERDEARAEVARLQAALDAETAERVRQQARAEGA